MSDFLIFDQTAMYVAHFHNLSLSRLDGKWVLAGFGAGSFVGDIPVLAIGRSTLL